MLSLAWLPRTLWFTSIELFVAAGDPPTWAAQGDHLGRGGFDDVVGTTGLEKVTGTYY